MDVKISKYIIVFKLTSIVFNQMKIVFILFNIRFPIKRKRFVIQTTIRISVTKFDLSWDT